MLAAARSLDTLTAVCRPHRCLRSALRAMASNAPSQTPQPPPRRARVAVGQMTAVGDQRSNFETCKHLAVQAKEAGACMLFLPECFSFIGASPPELLSKAESLEGPTMQQYRQLARDTGLWLSLGGFQELGPDPQHLFNTHVVLDSAGQTVASYRKVHLFDVDVPNGPVLLESRTTAPGNQLVACDSPAGRLGLTICYDLRFPAVYEALTWTMGAQVLLVPSAFTQVTGAAHWEVLLRARAIENQAYVIAAAQAGRHNESRASYGHSLVINPWGVVVARLEDPHATGVAVAELDFSDALDVVRQKMPIAEHRAAGRQLLAGQLGG